MPYCASSLVFCLLVQFAEAWNNLAGAYMKKNDKVRAHRIYQEALRCSFENSKIWQNFLLVCFGVDIMSDLFYVCCGAGEC